MYAVDTPGLNEGKEADRKHLNGLVDFFKIEVKELNLFLILINSSEPRMTKPLVDALSKYEQNLTANFWKNVSIVFTRWGASPHAEKTRKAQGGVTKEMRKSEFMKFMEDNFPGRDTSHMKFYWTELIDLGEDYDKTSSTLEEIWQDA